MAITVSRKAIVKDFILESDETGEAKVVIRQATQGDVVRRADLFSRATQVVSMTDADGDTMRYEQQFNVHKQRRMEIYLTLVGASGFEDEKGKALFRVKQVSGEERIHMSEQEFNKAIDLLPPDVFLEIHKCVLDVNTMWDSSAQGE
jgi:hypothetical protein